MELAILAAALLGCGDGPPAPGSARLSACSDEAPPADGNETVLIGKSDGDVFHPLTQAETFVIHHGPQGGQHTFVSAKLFTLKSNQWEHHFDLIDSATQSPAGGTRVAVTSCGGQWLVTHDVALFLDYDSIADGIIRLQSEPAPSAGLDKKLNAEASVHFVSD